MSSDDLFEQTFAGLDDYYPGSKRKRKEPVVKAREIEPVAGWDTKPIKKTLPNGNEVEMFTIGALAEAMGRPLITIRTWIKEGYLPASPYRLPSKTTSDGKEIKGNRLYSRAMIEKLVEMFDSAGLLYTKRVEWSLHRQLSNEIAEAWSNIRANETNAN